MDEEKILETLKDHEERIRNLEQYLPKQKIKEKIESYKGLSGGINLLINNNYFNELRSLGEVLEELKREGYHHSKGSLAKMLSVNFVKKKKILTRLKEGKVWKYVLRK